MVSFRPAEPQRGPIELAVPTHITFRAATATKSVFLSVYCHEPERIVNLIQRLVQQSGGVSVHQSTASDGSSRLLIGAQLPSLASTDFWQMRAAIQKAGGMVETVRVNYQIRRPASRLQERPKVCMGCRYYYGKSHGNAQLICAMHPFGSDEACPDWAAVNV